ncbi:hypothetical protein BROUX41_003266 [Berkeleyomyces rouxiae]|uniref:uncharacterized protein n=1 Tax=Berkeleyomyces rouxiae TaxID=2035830 RepID=UPI003B785C78
MFAQSQPPDRGQPHVRNPFLPFGVPNQTFAGLVTSVLSEIQPVSASWPEQDCLFADVGEYLVKCAEVLADMADKLSNSHHLAYQIHHAQQQQQWNRECFNYQFYLAHKNECLKSITNNLRNTAETLRIEWNKSDHPPHPHHNQSAPRGAVGMAQGYGQDHSQQHPAHQQHPQQQQHPQAQQHPQQHRLPTMAPSTVPVSSVVSGPPTPQQQQPQQQQPPVSAGMGPATSGAPGPVPGIVRRDPPTTRTTFAPTQYAPQNGAPVAYSQEPVYPLASSATSGSMEPMEDELSVLDEERVRQLLNQPQHRGVGQHYCPLGERCDKGGVSPDGTIRLFERNSDFRTHLKKHIKMYKCPVPGCKNVEGFGRKDQLERHIRTTKHGSAPGGNPGPPQMAPAPQQPEFVPPMGPRY